jgi:hypothetical protein
VVLLSLLPILGLVSFPERKNDVNSTELKISGNK